MCTFYNLCPLIDHRNFLGISQDTDVGSVVVTLGKNMVIRYKLSDQKQLGSWSTKDKLSTPVVYDCTGNQYIGIFNSEVIAFWKVNDTDLNKVKKYKFSWALHCVLTSPGLEPVIVYKNGAVSPISIEIENRKESLCKNILPDNLIIKDCSLFCIQDESVAVIHTVCSSDNVQTIYFIPVEDKENTTSLKLIRNDDISLKCSGCHLSDEGKFFQLFTLWSDGKLYQLNLSYLLENCQEFPGRLVTTLNTIKTEEEVALKLLNKNQLIVYGAGSNAEGAVMLIVNTEIGLIETSSKLLKTFFPPPKLWLSGQYVALLSAGHIIASLIQTSDKQKLSRLMSSNIIRNETELMVPLIDWDEDYEGKSESSVLNVESFQNINLQNCPDSELISSLQRKTNISDYDLILLLAKYIECLPDSKDIVLTILSTRFVGDIATLALIRKLLPIATVTKLLSFIIEIIQVEKMEPDSEVIFYKWISAIFDAHFQMILIDKQKPEMKEMLMTFRELLSKQKKIMTSLQLTNLDIQKLMNNRRHPTKCYKNVYKIEKIKLY